MWEQHAACTRSARTPLTLRSRWWTSSSNWVRRASMSEKSLITPLTDRWPYEGTREKRRLKETSAARLLHDAEWKLDDGASSRSSTKERLVRSLLLRHYPPPRADWLYKHSRPAETAPANQSAGSLEAPPLRGPVEWYFCIVWFMTFLCGSSVELFYYMLLKLLSISWLYLLSFIFIVVSSAINHKPLFL